MPLPNWSLSTGFHITPGLDAGDHTDFTSSNGDRIDVTTNPNYKKLSQYEPIQKKEGASYKIAVVDRCGRLYKLVDINFPFCDVCEQGRLIDVVVLKELDNNYHGEQILVQICSHCNAGKELNRIQTPFLAPLSSTLSEEMQAYEDRSYEDHLFEPESHRKKAHSRYISTTLPYLHRTFDKSIIALGEVRGEMPDPRDVDWIESNLSIFWRDPMKLFDDYVLESYFLDPDSRFHDDIIY